MNYSVLMELAEIKDFVKHCKKDNELAGFNVVCDPKSRGSFVLGKTNESLQAKYVLKTEMDYANPIERPLIANAIHEAMHMKSMSAEAMENEMVRKTTHEESH